MGGTKTKCTYYNTFCTQLKLLDSWIGGKNSQNKKTETIATQISQLCINK